LWRGLSIVKIDDIFLIVKDTAENKRSNELSKKWNLKLYFLDYPLNWGVVSRDKKLQRMVL
jgi:hypothetical protein